MPATQSATAAASATSRSGGLAIGFRRNHSDWQRDSSSLIAFAQAHGIKVIDLPGKADEQIAPLQSAGITIGTIDLPDWEGLMAADGGRRADAVARNGEHVARCAAVGLHKHFMALRPEDAQRPARENFALLRESLPALAEILERHDAWLGFEGWPGPGVLGCTPEQLRAIFAACPSPSLGVNYDPSHLVRLGIDELRFAREFAARIKHVHGKDCALIDEGRYLCGHELPSLERSPHHYGGHAWRYTIPGHGQVRWTAVLDILLDAGYDGALAIELEDEQFGGSPESEQAGLSHALRFLQSC